MHTEDGNPAASLKGNRNNATQQSKHFQQSSATVLCATVNFEAQVCPANLQSDQFGCGEAAIPPLAD
jgi:hypothetical protein